MEGLQQLLDGMNHEWFHIGDWKVSPLMLIRLVTLLAVVLLTAWIVRSWAKRIFARHGHIDKTIANAVVSITYFVWLTLGLLWVLDESGFDVASLAVFTGALGVGMGLGLQDMAKNFFAGLIMLATRPVRIGDHVEFSGLSGRVVSIGAYSTTLRTLEHASVVVPNASLLNDKVVNWDLSGEPRLVILTFKVPQSVESSKVIDVLRKVADANDAALDSPPPTALIDGFEGSLVVYHLWVYTGSAAHEPAKFKGDLYLASLEALKSADIPLTASVV